MAPDPARWLARLRDPSDRVAAEEFAAEHFPNLLAWLRGRFRRADDHLVGEAAGQALFEFLKDPGRYDPGRRSLAGYLRMAAGRDLLNLLRRERRHHPGARVVVELDGFAGKSLVEGPARFDNFPALAAVRDALPERERAVLDLMLRGERADRVFAAALGIADRPAAELQAEVKRVKDRIRARLRRAARR